MAQPRILRQIVALLILATVGLVLARLIFNAVWFNIVQTIVLFCCAFVIGPFVAMRLIVTGLQLLFTLSRLRTAFLRKWLLPNLDNMILYTVGLVAVSLAMTVFIAGTLRLLALI